MGGRWGVAYPIASHRKDGGGGRTEHHEAWYRRTNGRSPVAAMRRCSSSSDSTVCTWGGRLVGWLVGWVVGLGEGMIMTSAYIHTRVGGRWQVGCLMDDSMNMPGLVVRGGSATVP